MITGAATLDRLLKAMQQEQARMGELDASLNRSNDELIALDGRRVAELRRLAQLRLATLANKHAAPGGTDDEQVLKFVAQRDAAYAALKRQQALQAEAANQLEESSAAASSELEAAMQAVDSAEAGTQKRLQADPAYQRQLEAAREADRVANQAEAKATQSENEQESKGAAYRADPLFSYLWRRKYGTPEYRPGGLVFAPLLRYLDGRVARLVGYQGARANYARLLEIPLRLREHATRAKRAADAAHAELQRLDLQARADDGIVKLEEARATAQAKVGALEAKIREAGEGASQIQAALKRFADGQDPDYQGAVEFLRNEYDSAPLEVLRASALATPTPEDDLVVSRLTELSRRREELAATIAELRTGAEANRKRWDELTQLRNDFAQAGMSAPTAAFRDEKAVTSGIAQYLAGMLTMQALWQLFTKQRTHTSQGADPTFGSGGFGRGTVWGNPVPPVKAGQVIDVVGSILDAIARSSGGRPSGGWPGGGSGRSSGGPAWPGGGSSRSGGGFKPSGGSRPSGGGMPKRGGFKTGGKF